MKLALISASLASLASAAPQKTAVIVEGKSSPQDATVLASTPVWGYHSDFMSDEYYGDTWHYTISLEEVPNAGENIFDICTGIMGMIEGWCPKSEDQAMRVYSELVVRHFMPNSHATGVLDESEVSNIPSSIMTGYRTDTWTPLTIPEPINNVDAVSTRGSGATHDVYQCGPNAAGAKSGPQTWDDPTIGFIDATASAPNHCTEIGNNGFYGDDFDKNFALKNVDCASTRYVFCSDMWEPMGTSHSGHQIETVELSSTSVDIMKAAFVLLNDPESALNKEVEKEIIEDDGGDLDLDSGDAENTDKAGKDKKMKMGAVVILVAVIIFLILGKK